ncbi:MAG TPA: peroxiredoxin family protein [Candidatus Eisenbacteria bacterium]|nr:peroxiredoxin family protein [Candidatus Eisenbacteria bacterium]
MKTRALCTLALFVVPALHAAPPDARMDATPGPKATDVSTRMPIAQRGIASRVDVGQTPPGFELTSAKEERVKLSGFRGERVLLCFADRREMISEYRAAADTLRAMGIRMIGIARDSPRSLRSLALRDSLDFELLSDPTGEVAAVYGSYDYPASSIRPGYVLVGRTNTVRMVVLGQRLPAQDLVQITRYALAGL